MEVTNDLSLDSIMAPVIQLRTSFESASRAIGLRLEELDTLDQIEANLAGLYERCNKPHTVDMYGISTQQQPIE